MSHSFNLAVNRGIFTFNTYKQRYGRKVLRALRSLKSDYKSSFRHAAATMPLLREDKTYNTAHPDYDATLVRNYPGRIFGYDIPSENRLFNAIKPMALADRVPDKAWAPLLDEMLAEAKTVPGAEQVFERKEFVERYIADQEAKYKAHYMPGWVNLEDALFLYWVIRTFKPKTVVQTGVCNGLSTAFMMLALAKNGPEGQLHAIDLAHIFDPNNPDWTVPGMVYGVLIPEGKTSGWMVPDMYKDRCHIENGDAKELLPKLIDRLPSLDMFYHDSDHSYQHMMFEFDEAMRKLDKGGIVLGDDVSWNASVWDFADKHGVPSYNYKGAVGVAFL